MADLPQPPGGPPADLPMSSIPASLASLFPQSASFAGQPLPLQAQLAAASALGLRPPANALLNSLASSLPPDASLALANSLAALSRATAAGGASAPSFPAAAAPVAAHLAVLPSPQRAKAEGGRSRGGSATHRKQCNCKNSRCLKLYCECFASGRYCDACNCVNCFNNRENEAVRQAAVEAILERNPNAFRPKIQNSDEAAKAAAAASASALLMGSAGGGGGGSGAAVDSARHLRGCNCKKSTCLKKYCECFQAGIFCSNNCKCVDCKNFEGSEAHAQVLAATQDLMLTDTGRAAAVTLIGNAPHLATTSPAGVAAAAKRARTGGVAGLSGLGGAGAGGAFAGLSPHALAAAAAAAGLTLPGGFGGPSTSAAGGGFGAAPLTAAAAVTPRGAVHSTVRDAMRGSVIKELCSLLLVVASEEGEKVAREKGGESGLDAKALQAAVYAAQEKVVLEEFSSTLPKIVRIIEQKAREEAAAAVASQMGLPPASLALAIAANAAAAAKANPSLLLLQGNMAAAAAAAAAAATGRAGSHASTGPLPSAALNAARGAGAAAAFANLNRQQPPTSLAIPAGGSALGLPLLTPVGQQQAGDSTGGVAPMGSLTTLLMSPGAGSRPAATSGDGIGGTDAAATSGPRAMDTA